MNSNEVLQRLLEVFVSVSQLEYVDKDMPKATMHQFGKLVESALVQAIKLIQEQYKIPDSEIDLRIDAIEEYMANIRKEAKTNE